VDPNGIEVDISKLSFTNTKTKAYIWLPPMLMVMDQITKLEQCEPRTVVSLWELLSMIQVR
jgi:hypothetical protein